MPRPTSGISPILDDLLASSGIVPGLRAAASLAHAAGMDPDPDVVLETLLDVVHDPSDQLARLAAVHAVSAIRGPSPTRALTVLLDHDDWSIAEHAAWALSGRSPHRPAMVRLATMVADGGFTGMLAQRTLGGWATGDRRAAHDVLTGALHATTAGGPRRRLVETLGLVPGAETAALLESIATSEGEGRHARGAAIAALGDRPGEPATLVGLTDRDDELAPLALLALLDRGHAATTARRDTNGLRIAQLFLHADLEPGTLRAGAGDNGGIATLLGLLSEEIATRRDVDLVLTIGRGQPADALVSEWTVADQSERFAAVAFGPPGGVEMRAAWPYRVEIERGVRRALRACGPIDALHLRMADIGTLAAARVARSLEIPVVFTVAPDPHVVLRSLEADRSLTRANFGDADALEHWWFRARMVERLTAQAARVALLPRPGMTRDLRELLGYEPDSRATVVPEGVRAATVRRAAADARSARRPGELGGAVAALVGALERMPAERRDLPLIVSVGRLHPLKGFDRLVAAWAGDGELAATTNLVIVGGDLAAPSPDELDVLSAIDDVVAEPDHAGLVLLGHRPHHEVANLLAVAAGRSSLLANGGIYVGAARKEEFGLAIIEALAAGLPVVAPEIGGPATYVVDGLSGMLVDTMSTEALAGGMRRALRLAALPGRAEAASEHVLEHFTIERMADRLVDMYASMTPART